MLCGVGKFRIRLAFREWPSAVQERFVVVLYTVQILGEQRANARFLRITNVPTLLVGVVSFEAHEKTMPDSSFSESFALFRRLRSVAWA